MTHSKPTLLAVHALLYVALSTGIAAAQEAGAGNQNAPGSTATREIPLAKPDPTIQALMDFLGGQTPARMESLDALRSNWDTNLVPFIVDTFRFLAADDARTSVLARFLKRMTGESFDTGGQEWVQWLWKQEYVMHPDYPDYRAALFATIDPRFTQWFYKDMPHTIRIDEIMWGGVKVDGIPPLNRPAVIPAEEASYLGKNDVVFGVYVNGKARAYPKRVLAWHEMTNDTVGDTPLTLVYCTLCGSAILYDPAVGGRRFAFGTSGFLYRSNKLMYDDETLSLWSALEGVPVTGKLVGSGLQLKRLPIVTTTWGAWRERHPETTVLSRETGFDRDYGEGVAYRTYFSTDRLMFPVPAEDKRLKNKQEVLALLVDRQPVAFDTSFLQENPLHVDSAGDQDIVVLTDESGANRVYDAEGVTFSEWDGREMLTDQQGQKWKVTEMALTGPEGQERERIPAHRAFWFGWHAQFPESRLVK